MMQLQANDLAPDFSTYDVFDRPIQLSRFTDRHVLLSFLRYSSCALCNLRVHQLIQHYPVLTQLGCEVIVVFESTRESITQYVSRQQAPFSIIADPQAQLYDRYGVQSSEAKVMANLGTTEKQKQMVQAAAAIGYALHRDEGDNFFRLPADFLIGPDQKIRAAFYSDILGDHMALADIEQMLKAASVKAE